LVVSAFFEALDDLSGELRAALDSASLELTGAEETALATGASPVRGAAGLADLARGLTAPGAVPGLAAGWSSRGFDLKDFYTAMARRVRGFATGTAAWDRNDETTRGRWTSNLNEELPQRALARYEGRLGQLAGEFPE